MTKFPQNEIEKVLRYNNVKFLDMLGPGFAKTKDKVRLVRSLFLRPFLRWVSRKIQETLRFFPSIPDNTFMDILISSRRRLEKSRIPVRETLGNQRLM